MTTSSGAVLVTGASSGMGKACALRLSQAGYTVFAGVRRERDVELLKQERSSRLIPVILDVTNEHTIAEAYQVIRERAGAAGLVGLMNRRAVYHARSFVTDQNRLDLSHSQNCAALIYFAATSLLP